MSARDCQSYEKYDPFLVFPRPVWFDLYGRSLIMLVTPKKRLHLTLKQMAPHCGIMALSSQKARQLVFEMYINFLYKNVTHSNQKILFNQLFYYTFYIS